MHGSVLILRTGFMVSNSVEKRGIVFQFNLVREIQKCK